MRLLSKRNLLFVLCCFCLNLGVAIDTITSSQSIKDPGNIVSNGNAFKLGFFSPVNSTNRYIGIWYSNISVFTVVWVANRETPLNDSSGVLTISEDGNLVVLDGKKRDSLDIKFANSSAQLLDSGNLVLQEKTTGTIIWESFQLPCDTLLPKMKISTNVRTGNKVQLTSWQSLSDPSIGSFSVNIQPLNLPQAFIWKYGSPYWRSGPWNKRVYIGMPTVDYQFQDEISLINDQEGTFSSSFTSENDSLLHFALNAHGNLEEIFWDYEKDDWEVSYLQGFEPKNTKESNRGNWTSGCVRRTQLQCERVKTGSEGNKTNGFLKLNSHALEADCRQQCLENCSCLAYAYDTGIGCMSWTGSLIDAQKFSSTGVNLYIRLAYSDLATKKDMKKIVTITVIIGTVSILIYTYLLWRWIAKHKARKKKEKEILLFNKGEAHKTLPSDNLNQVKVQELPLFNFEKLVSATNNFHLSNKVGQGGFGSVYKGKLSDGQEIAVKILSRTSAQGFEEFMNEAVVISKLQHRNLVRLLGCCVEGEERMLIYEYMPIKSLDAFLFDPCKYELLDWRERFNIIQGIGRGLLYLHRDSRLRIIHRDLKASNILIFRGNEDQANTRRVVGTYGYMSPEYVIEWRFSEKSDVFNFGVLLLEIVSGRKNTGFYNDKEFLSLLGLAWKLWNSDNTVALIDSMISEPFFEMEILRCIQVGLLCVQEFAKDRPTLSVVVSILKSEIVDMPHPKKPAFIERLIALDTESSQRRKCIFSINNVTMTTVQGR
ncbi:hypothetical protein RGQ29_018940 [Quercus rubra]|uniref:Receptor-like serine/threonine-protein kinase n=1 Tax=Quercus rubra TaxID=3512 RepID=A0AAN7F781_QUERU|nr:hypothetical protein RGQ29_018940 [Quercus rubra]